MLQDPTKIFDQHCPEIEALIKERGWRRLGEKNKIDRIFDFVKNEIMFGFSKEPLLSASQVLLRGRGDAINKSILLKTLLDACNVLCRFHSFKVNKEMYQGIVSPLNYKLLPEHLISAWIEIFYNGQWLVADGVLLDSTFMNQIQKKFHEAQKEFVGFGCAMYLENGPQTEWNGVGHSYCQRAAITRDLGLIEEFDWYFTEFTKDFKQLGHIFSKKSNSLIQGIRNQT